MTRAERWRPKDVFVWAMQWAEEDDAFDIIEWAELYDTAIIWDTHVSGASGPNGEDWGHFTVETYHGDIEIAPYDYVVLGITGEFFVRKPADMVASYWKEEK